MKAELVQHIPLREHMAGVYNALAADHTQDTATTKQQVETALTPEVYRRFEDDTSRAAKTVVARAILEDGAQACQSLADVQHWMACLYSADVHAVSQSEVESVIDVGSIFTALTSAIENDLDTTIDKPAALEAVGKWMTYAISLNDEAVASQNLPNGLNVIGQRTRAVAHRVLLDVFSDSYIPRQQAGLLDYDNLNNEIVDSKHETRRGLVYAAMAVTDKSERGYQRPLEFTHQELIGKLRKFYQENPLSQNISGQAMEYVVDTTFARDTIEGHATSAEYVGFVKNYATQALALLHDTPGLNPDVRRYVRTALGELEQSRHSATEGDDTTVKSQNIVAIATGLSRALNKQTPQSEAIQIGDTVNVRSTLHAAELLQAWAYQQAAALPNVLPQTKQCKSHMQSMLQITRAINKNIVGGLFVESALPALTREQARPNYDELVVSRHLPELEGLLERWDALGISLEQHPPLVLMHKASTLQQSAGERKAAISAYIHLALEDARRLDVGVKSIVHKVAQKDKFFNVHPHIQYIAGWARESGPAAAPQGADYTSPVQRLVLLANQWRTEGARALDPRNPVDQLEAQKLLLVATVQRAMENDSKFQQRRGARAYGADLSEYLKQLEEDKKRIIANQARAREARAQAQQPSAQERGTTGDRRRPLGPTLGY